MILLQGIWDISNNGEKTVKISKNGNFRAYGQVLKDPLPHVRCLIGCDCVYEWREPGLMIKPE